jgi:hypothetical protein
MEQARENMRSGALKVRLVKALRNTAERANEVADALERLPLDETRKTSARP